MAGFGKLKDDLAAVGAKIFAASVDPLDKAQEVAVELPFPVGYGVTRDVANRLGSWWEERRSIIQPSEFLVDASGKVVASSYSDGPIGRIEAGDVIKVINFREAQAKK